jgi:hypothetical protein
MIWDKTLFRRFRPQGKFARAGTCNWEVLGSNLLPVYLIFVDLLGLCWRDMTYKKVTTVSFQILYY